MRDVKQLRMRTGLGVRASVLALFLTCHSALSLAQVAVPPAVDRVVHDYAEVLTGESVSEMERVHRKLFLEYFEADEAAQQVPTVQF